MTPSEAPASTSSFRLADRSQAAPADVRSATRRLLPFLVAERRSLAVALGAVLLSSAASLLAPAIIARTVDTSIAQGDFQGVLLSSALLLVVYALGVAATYLQTLSMGGVGRRVLFSLRDAIFDRLQQLPLAFFAQNKAGDLIARINQDTEKLNVFFAQGIVQLTGNVMLMTGAAIALLVLDAQLGLSALAPAAGILLVTRALSPWVRRRNARSLQATGGLSAEIQEHLDNFAVIVAFNRRDYFRARLEAAAADTYTAAVAAGRASNVFVPMYGLAANLAQLAVLIYGIVLVTEGRITVGLLIGFLLYVNSFYMPLRQVAAVWPTFQLALAALDRIGDVLALRSDQAIVAAGPLVESDAVLAFDGVGFRYPAGAEVLHDATFTLARGKTYALVGPTGGGKTTTASLMARLYDPTHGRVLLEGRDIRSYSPDDRARKVGFILQEPFLFTGTIRENLLYGNLGLQRDPDSLPDALTRRGLHRLLERFDRGLDTIVTAQADGLSLGQKQIVAFMRAVLRDPALLILDEATANIDTVTERLLDEILRELPATTTRVVIAHRLNTIANADEIFFVNAGTITPAGSMEHALDMLLHHHRAS